MQMESRDPFHKCFMSLNLVKQSLLQSFIIKKQQEFLQDLMDRCISRLGQTAPDNGLTIVWCQAIIWTNAGLLSIEPLGTNIREIWIKIQ